jgi:hypothetical protein
MRVTKEVIEDIDTLHEEPVSVGLLFPSPQAR